MKHLAQFRHDLEISRELFARALADEAMLRSVCRAAEMVMAGLQSGGKLLLAGNGGSAADAQHLATELVVRFKKSRAPLPAIALTTDTSALTAIGNDLGFEHLFSRQIEALGRPGDVFLGLSTSGRSPNILAACRAARMTGMAVIGFTGAGGGAMDGLCDTLVRVPSDDTPFVQQVHIAIGHTLCAIAEDSLEEQA